MCCAKNYQQLRKEEISGITIKEAKQISAILNDYCTYCVHALAMRRDDSVEINQITSEVPHSSVSYLYPICYLLLIIIMAAQVLSHIN